jgi:hypothetical protein
MLRHVALVRFLQQPHGVNIPEDILHSHCHENSAMSPGMAQVIEMVFKKQQ